MFKITKSSIDLPFHQFEYSQKLYKSEILQHENDLKEYEEIYQHLIDNCNNSNLRPNLELYQQQPYINFNIRLKLIEFLLKMSIRLKILPFVFFRAVKIFDRYCSKRIILLDQSQLIITTCLWIASKIQGGNNHFINLNNIDKMSDIKTINDLGYGSGGKFLGPTERFRLPKLHELVKLCGNKCKYDNSMFKQMELHILTTLNWNFNDASIDDFIMKSQDFNINNNNNEFFKIKEYLSYVSLYSNELIDVNIIDLSKVIVDLINETFNLNENHYYYQTLNGPLNNDEDFFIEGETNLPGYKFDLNTYKFIKKNLIKAILKSSDFLLQLFNSRGPQFLYNQMLMNYNDQFNQLSQSSNSVQNSPSQGNDSFRKDFISSQPPSIPVPYPPSTPTDESYIYKPIPILSHSLIKKFDIKINTNHQHNNSTLSINSSQSINTSNTSIFDLDSRKFGVYTPVSDEDSPIYHFK